MKIKQRYSHRNGETLTPEVEGEYWLEFVKDGETTFFPLYWGEGAEAWASIRSLLPGFSGIYGPILTPDEPPLLPSKADVLEALEYHQFVEECASDLVTPDARMLAVAVDALRAVVPRKAQRR